MAARRDDRRSIGTDGLWPLVRVGRAVLLVRDKEKSTTYVVVLEAETDAARCSFGAPRTRCLVLVVTTQRCECEGAVRRLPIEQARVLKPCSSIFSGHWAAKCVLH